MPSRIDFQTEPARYRHWKLAFEGEVARLIMDVDENAGLFDGYQLKLNSYDLGVDIELADAVQRLRFEHPEVKVVVLQSGKDRVFCAGANIRMLAGSSHAHKVNFCKFTNETRNAMEDASAASGQKYMCAVRGTAAGGGYELALATDHILLADDGNSTVALPELPLLAVLPGTGGLTRVTDKRKVRRDLADAFCTIEEGVRGSRAVKWRLVDQTAPNSKFDQAVKDAAKKLAARSDRPADAQGIELTPLQRAIEADAVIYSSVRVDIDRATRRRHHHHHRTIDAATRFGRGHARRGRPVLAAAAGARARRRHPAPAPQRGRDRRADLQVAGRAGPGAGLRCVPRRQQEPLARARNPALLEAHSEARGRDLPLAGGAGRARQLFCRYARRNSPRLRPLLHARRQLQGRQPRPCHAGAVGTQLRRLSHEQRSLTADHAVPRRAGQRRGGEVPERQGAGGRSRARSWVSSPPCSITSTGTTRCASSWRSAPRSPPTA